MAAELLPASRGVGPLLQRDYWAVFEDCSLRPSEIIAYVRTHFCELPPKAVVAFTAPGGIEFGLDLDIQILPARQCCVRVVHQDAQSFTLGTLDGHPEAGRITFGAYRNPKEDVVFQIRSRARSAGLTERIGFLAIGDAMQTHTWTEFITNTAAAIGARIRGPIHAESNEVEERPDDGPAIDGPTFRAVGD